MEFFMVLNDGTTYTSLAGCRIVAAEFSDGLEGLDPDDLDEAIAGGHHPNVVTVTVFG